MRRHVTDRLEAYITENQARFPNAHPTDVFALARDAINFELDVADPEARKIRTPDLAEFA